MGDVIEFGELKIRKANTRNFYDAKTCQHKVMIIDANGGTVECEACKAQISPFYALDFFASEWQKMSDKLKRDREDFERDKAKEISLLAAQRVEKAWRARGSLPTCPHCHQGISPYDGFGSSSVNKRMEQRRRDANRNKP